MGGEELLGTASIRIKKLKLTEDIMGPNKESSES